MLQKVLIAFSIKFILIDFAIRKHPEHGIHLSGECLLALVTCSEQ